MGITSQQGVHGLRYRENRLQIFTNGMWTDRPYPVRVYGVRIDTQAADPFASVVYTDDAAGLTPGGAEWDKTPIFAGIRPCVLQGGSVQYYLQPNDYTKRLDGSEADITSGAHGDVMVEIPRLAYMLAREGKYQIIKVTNSPRAKEIDSRFCYYAHSRTQEGDREKLYYGAYPAWYDGAALHSLSGKTPTGSQTHAVFRAAAHNRGSGYDMIGFYPLMLLQCLCVLRYKSLDSQTALGQGYVEGGTAPAITGAADRCGMFCGAAGENGQMKFAGIEDFWGNIYQAVDGVFLDAQRNILTAFDGFNDDGGGYTGWGQACEMNLTGTCMRIHGTSETGFIMSERTLITGQYWCDGSATSASSMAMMGGMYGAQSSAGAFMLRLNRTSASTHPGVGTRLMFL